MSLRPVIRRDTPASAVVAIEIERARVKARVTANHDLAVMARGNANPLSEAMAISRMDAALDELLTMRGR